MKIMVRKFLYIFMFLCMILSINGISSNVFAASEYAVDIDGSIAGSFRTVQEALDVASDGDTIKVYPGVYVVPFSITGDNKISSDKANISFTGVEESGKNPVIIYNDVDSFTEFNNATFSGITLEAYSTSSVIANATKVGSGGHTTIASALAAVGDYDVIVIDGAVNEATDLSIDKPVTIIGKNNATITLNLAASQINISSKNVSLNYVTITGITKVSKGILVNVQNSGFNMTKVSITGLSANNLLTGYVNLNGNDIRLDKCSFTLSKASVPYINSDDVCTVDANDCVFNLDIASGIGIKLSGEGSNNVLIKDSKFNFTKTLLTGVDCIKADKVLIENSLFDQVSSSGKGLILSDANELTVTGSTFKNTTNKTTIEHIVATNVKTVTIENSGFSASGQAQAATNPNNAVVITNSDKLSVINSTIDLSGAYNKGLIVSNVSDVDFKDTKINITLGTQMVGALLTGTPDLSVESCTFNIASAGVATLQNYGIDASDVKTTTITNSKLAPSANYTTGIKVNGANDATEINFINNSSIDIKGTAAIGLESIGIPTVKIDKATLELTTGNRSQAISIGGAKNIILNESKINCIPAANGTNKNYGIYSDGGDSFTMTKSQITTVGNYSYGLNLENFKDVSINGEEDILTFDISGTYSIGANLVSCGNIIVEKQSSEVKGDYSKGIVASTSNKFVVNNSKIEVPGKSAGGIVVDAADVTIFNNLIILKGVNAFGIETSNAEIGSAIDCTVDMYARSIGIKFIKSKNITTSNFNAYTKDSTNSQYSTALAFNNSENILVTDSSFEMTGPRGTGIMGDGGGYNADPDLFNKYFTITNCTFVLEAPTGDAYYTYGIQSPGTQYLTVKDNTFYINKDARGIGFGYGQNHLITDNTLIGDNARIGIASDGIGSPVPHDDKDDGQSEESRTVIEKNIFKGTFERILFISNNNDIIRENDFTLARANYGSNAFQIAVRICKGIDIINNQFAAAESSGQAVIRLSNSVVNLIDENTFQLVPGAYEVLAADGSLLPADNGLKYPESVTSHSPLNTINGVTPIEIENEYVEPSTPYQYILRLAPDTSSVSLEAEKTIAGGTLGNYKFDFAVLDEDGDTVVVAQNDSDGKIEFPAIPVTEAGTFNYKIVETSRDSKNWKVDTKVFNVTVEVTVNNENTLVGEVRYSETPIFTNTYTPDPISTIVSGTKKAVGAELKGGQFNFEISDGTNVVATGTNTKDGVIEFTPINFSGVGIYNYSVKESSVSSGQWTCDDKVYNISVDVTQNLDNTLSAKINYPEEGIIFTNTYTVPTVEEEVGKITLHISKKLFDRYENPIGTDKKFAIRLYDSEFTLIDRMILTANDGEVVIENVKSGQTYYLREEEGLFTILGYDIVGIGSYTDDILGFTIPEIPSNMIGDIYINVNNFVEVENLSSIPDGNVPLTPITPPDGEDIPVIDIPLADIQLENIGPDIPEEPVIPENPDIPETGDIDIIGLIAIFSISLAILAVIFRKNISSRFEK